MRSSLNQNKLYQNSYICMERAEIICLTFRTVAAIFHIHFIILQASKLLWLKVQNVWKYLLLTILVQREIDVYITPSTSAGAKSSSGLLPKISAAFPRIRVMESRWKSCLVATFSSLPWFRAMAAPIRLTCSTAT